MDEDNKNTRTVPLQSAIQEIFGDCTPNNEILQKSAKSFSANCTPNDLPDGVTLNFNPTINVVAANSDSHQDTKNNPSLVEVGKFMTGLAGFLSMFIK